MRKALGWRVGLTSLLALAVGCGGGSFELAAEGSDTSPGDDTGGAGDASGVDTSTDAPVADGGSDAKTDGVTLDAVPPIDSGPPVCGALPAGATDIYVDKRYLGGASTGTSACPYTNITAALAVGGSFAGTRTIHVAGGVVPVIYNEASSLNVATGIVLLGDGPARTTINASGACGSGTCAVFLNGGTTVDGFTVTSASGDGILVGGGGAAPIVRNANVNGAKGNGISLQGAIELGPNLSVNRNGLQGVVSAGAGLVHVVAGANTFDNNGANGIDIEGNATLKFDGGTASGNAINGIRLGWTAPTLGAGPAHSITALTATGNKNNGIGAYNGQNFKLRTSKVLNNSLYGLYYGYAGTSAIDLGTVADVGGNTFGTAAASSRNGKAGIYLCKSRGPATQPAEGDLWAMCTPGLTQLSLAGCDSTPGSYVDVAYAPATIGDPVVVTSCSTAP